MKEEIWRNIPGYEDYQFSNLGRVKSFKNGKERILKPALRKDGYYQIGLTKDGKQKLFLVHQLIAIAFLGHVIDGHNLVVNHINGVKTDNRVENLEIVSNRDNCSIRARKDRDTMSSPLPGASWSKSNKKWYSQYKYQGKNYNLGFYNTDKEASDKYFEAKTADENKTFENFILTIENKCIKSVNQHNKDGEFIRSWNRIRDIERELGIDNASICLCCRGRQKSAGGFIWKYASDCK